MFYESIKILVTNRKVISGEVSHFNIYVFFFFGIYLIDFRTLFTMKAILIHDNVANISEGNVNKYHT